MLFLLVSFISSNAFSQNNENDVIQLSGIVLADTSHVPIQLASVMVKNTRRGTNTDFLGFFSLVVRKKEHIQVSALGYKKASITIPDTLTSSRYGVYVRMIRDTVMLKETVVFPWPSVEQFKKVFVELQVPPDEYDIAKKNLAVANMKNIILGYNMDAYSNYNSYIQKQTDKLYYAGQIQPNNLLNPFAWGAFFKAIGNGDFSNKNK
ncbi:MAG: carboxypeptidase-like regulatory domain-containing protein [Bacteroidota bacterium]